PQAGDNIVFRIDNLEEYRFFCRRVARVRMAAARMPAIFGAAEIRPGSGRTATSVIQPPPKRPVVYFRFARHEPLFTDHELDELGVETRLLPLNEGFEHFITSAHEHVVSLGPTATLLFDSLSDLSGHYYSDRMIGNFFQLTCPLILQTGSLAYFTLRRNLHSYHAVAPITATTQIMVDLYQQEDSLFIRPIKTEGRNEEAAFVLFRLDTPERLTPINDSAGIVSVLNEEPWPGLRSASYRMVGVWDRLFQRAENTLEAVNPGTEDLGDQEEQKDQLLRLIIAREGRILELARRYFRMEELIAIWKRMIGTGFIGGKSVGMLLARAILRRSDPRWRTTLEMHDSFYVASDVYYTFLVINDCWWERQRQKDPATYLDGNDRARARILRGRFPDYIVERFADMIDYFGTSPIIVRSSSLLEDNFGNAFAGKYESVFCTMQGNRNARLQEFLQAVRVIYASTISDEALTYRQNRGILDQDEQMALLVQRVSGTPGVPRGSTTGEGGHYRGRWFFPHLAGVSFSYNSYAWHSSIDPAAGLMRLVFGLGTRAVDRADDDYTRVVALNAPERRPEAGLEEVRRHAQRRVDVLDLREGRHRSVYFSDLLQEENAVPLERVATRDRTLARRSGVPERALWILTFDPLLRNTNLVADMREMLETLREAYGTDVDMEFTINLVPDGGYRIALVQCRPLQVQGAHIPAARVPDLRRDEVVIRSTGGVVGHSRVLPVGRILYVRPDQYARLAESDRRALARVIRRVTSVEPVEGALMLIGPGRWGTSTPALGVPVQFTDIGRAAVLCEIDRIHAGLIADMSLGTHFFNEMVERNLLYLAVRVGQEDTILDTEYLEGFPNQLEHYLEASAGDWSKVVTVIHTTDKLVLNADSRNQTAILYKKRVSVDTIDVDGVDYLT
ncbi:MAG: pyruvate phosphate dikinase, partial [Spirochaetaceae bacterium]